MIIPLIIFVTILQADPLSTIWATLIDKGIGLAILAIIVVVIWKWGQNANTRLIDFMNTDRKEVLLALQNNTRALEKLTDAIEDVKK